jgi:hypothetical protein
MEWSTVSKDLAKSLKHCLESLVMHAIMISCKVVHMADILRQNGNQIKPIGELTTGKKENVIRESNKETDQLETDPLHTFLLQNCDL